MFFKVDQTETTGDIFSKMTQKPEHANKNFNQLTILLHYSNGAYYAADITMFDAATTVNQIIQSIESKIGAPQVADSSANARASLHHVSATFGFLDNIVQKTKDLLEAAENTATANSANQNGTFGATATNREEGSASPKPK